MRLSKYYRGSGGNNTKKDERQKSSVEQPAPRSAHVLSSEDPKPVAWKFIVRRLCAPQGYTLKIAHKMTGAEV